jgi:hypothetical protein
MFDAPIYPRATLAIRVPNARIDSLRGSQPSLIRPKWKRFRITSLKRVGSDVEQ